MTAVTMIKVSILMSFRQMFVWEVPAYYLAPVLIRLPDATSLLPAQMSARLDRLSVDLRPFAW
jgi:hypothetical protein